MGTPFQLRETHYSPESAFCENVTTFGTRIPIESVDLSGLTQVRAPYQGQKSRMNASEPDHVLVRGGSFSVTSNLIGHLGTAAAALTETWLQDLLSDGLGGGDIAATGTTINNTSTVTSLAVASVAGKALGHGLRVGVKGDGRGDGQFAIVNSPAGPITLLTALPGIPTNGDVVYGSQVAFHSESACLAGLTSKRFAISWVGSTGVEQIYIRGCQLSGLAITWPFNDVPKVTMTFVCAYWDYGNSLTIPSALTLQSNYTAALTGGSLFLQDYGTTTRQVFSPSEVELTYNIGTEPIIGPGSTFLLQSAIGFVRTRMQPTLRIRVPQAAYWPAWWDSVESASSHLKHVLFTASPVDGRATGVYLPRVKPSGQRPVPPVESNGQSYVDVFMVGMDDESRSTELARSAVRIFMG